MGDPDTSQRTVPQMPILNHDHVHTSRHNEELNAAVTKLLDPHVDRSGKTKPSITRLDVTSSADTDIHGNLHGFVATVNEHAPVTGLVTSKLGTGVTWMRVKMPRAPADEDDDDQEFDKKAFLKAFKDDRIRKELNLHERAPGVRIDVVKGEEFPSTFHYVVVTGNDRAAANHLLSEIAARGGVTVSDVVNGVPALVEAYLDVYTKSRQFRKTMAQEFATSHGLEIDVNSGQGWMETYFVQQHMNNLSKYIVYNNTVDPTEAQAGVMLYRGPIAGYYLATGPEHSSHGGLPTVSWENGSNDRLFSYFPADTGRFLGDETGRTPERHAGSNGKMEKVAKDRLRWGGPVQGYNPEYSHAYHALNDKHLSVVLGKLGDLASGTVSYTLMNMVAAELPGLETRDRPLPELVDILNKSEADALPVSTTSEVFVTMLRNWPEIQQELRPSSVLVKDVFARESGSATTVSADVLRAIHKISSGNFGKGE